MVSAITSLLSLCSTCPLYRLVQEQAERIAELEAKLARYENAHTPPSQRRKSSKPKFRCGRRRGRPQGYKGTTRPLPKPEEVVDVRAERCPRCNSKLGTPVKVESRIIEDIPEPPPGDLASVPSPT